MKKAHIQGPFMLLKNNSTTLKKRKLNKPKPFEKLFQNKKPEFEYSCIFKILVMAKHKTKVLQNNIPHKWFILYLFIFCIVYRIVSILFVVLVLYSFRW
ncbi:hypothetical protein RFI_04697 [Reticulomyxa filosa]|uniref:Uncharacterized protein n=1 Tax=Reticulomyxa filosa TaxID=46433 RepID=X6P2S5_RETFI|nr:hypothetical protein RFI_04697 [Reticulomyxa filosa]|eukprot:ETO32423.1 hypothetical protein RFI_04697 [Reticulomyxa filosa]